MVSYIAIFLVSFNIGIFIGKIVLSHRCCFSTLHRQKIYLQRKDEKKVTTNLKRYLTEGIKISKEFSKSANAQAIDCMFIHLKGGVMDISIFIIKVLKVFLFLPLLVVSFLTKGPRLLSDPITSGIKDFSPIFSLWIKCLFPPLK